MKPIISKTAKFIIAFVLMATISLLVFSVSYSWSGIIPLFASFGGEIVFLGLWIEKEADEEDKKEHRSNFIGDKERNKFKSEFGWWLLMVGIVVEIVFSVVLASIDIVENKIIADRINEADIRNLPIKLISGYARIVIFPTDDREMEFARNLHQTLPNTEPLFSEVQWEKSEGLLLIFGKNPNNGPETGIVELAVAARVSFLGTLVSNNLPYLPNICFDLKFDSRAERNGGIDLWNPNSVTINELKFLQIEGLGRGEVSQPLRVAGGEMTLFLNGFLTKKFLIPPQTNQFWRVSSFETNGAYVPAGYGLLTNSAVPTK